MLSLRYLFLILFLRLWTNSPLYAQPVQQEQFSEQQLREILSGLRDIRSAWAESEVLRATIVQYKQILESERQLADRRVETEADRTKLAEDRLALEKERAAFYEQAFRTVTRKRGAGCWLKKIVTLGLSRCQ